MKEGGIHQDARGNINRNASNKVCAQCKHFYVRVDKGDGRTSGLDEYGIHVSPDDERNSEEIRLCYEIHWCNAASPVCDDDFEPLGDEKYMTEDMRGEILCTLIENTNRVVRQRNEQRGKEIQYVYIGLLRESTLGDGSGGPGELIEVPTEIDGVATNYRRVEMGPIDWDLSFIDAAGTNFRSNDWGCTLSAPNTATNAIDINFPAAQTEWGGLSHFGMYDLPVGGRLICTSEFIVCMDIIAGNCAAIAAGIAEIPLEHLTNNNEKKGGE